MNEATLAARAEEGLSAVGPRPFYPTSSQQRRMYALHQLGQATTAYNMSMVLPIQAPYGIETVREFINWLVARHEILRTSFCVHEGEILQKVHAPMTVDVERESIEKAGLQEAMRAFIRPFDLSKAPLLRAKLAETEQGENWLLLDMHHIVGDQRSHEILGLDAERFVMGLELEPVRFHYKDFAVWQQEGPGRAVFERQKAFWLSHFKDGVPPPLELHCDHPRPAVLDFQGASIRTVLDAGSEAGLQAFCRRCRITPNMAFFAMFYILLFKYSSQEDIVVGCPVLGRDRDDLRDVLGMFVNTFALRSRPSADKPLKTFLAEIKALTLESLEHQLYPFEDLVEALDLERDPSRNPLFDVMFQYLRGSANTHSDKDSSAFDLTLAVFDGKRGTVLKWEYRTSLFEESTVRRMSAHFERLLEAALEDPQRRLGEMEMVSKGERAQLLGQLRPLSPKLAVEGQLDGPADVTFPRLFEAQAALRPDAVALVHDDVSLSYRELDARANQLAWHLRESYGVGPESLVAVLLERSIELVIAILAILKAGGAYAPINPRDPKGRIQGLLEDCGASLLLVESEHRFPGFSGAVQPLSQSDAWAGRPRTRLPASSLPESLLYVIFTSGSTGRPKGVALSHRSALNTLKFLENRFPLGPGQAVLMKTAYTFDVSAGELFGWFLGGGRGVVLENDLEKDPSAMADAIQRHNVTHLNVVPSALMSFLSAVAPQREQLAGIEALLVGGEPFTRELFNLVSGLGISAKLENLYGPTETAIDATSFPLDEYDGRSSIPIGRPLPGFGCIVFDRHGSLAPVGVMGELNIAGAGLARGYYKAPRLTAERFLPHPFARGERIYRTGDVARWLADGNLECRGRTDHQVKVRGFRIELGEIESALQEHPQVEACAAAARRNGSESRRLCAYVVARGPLESADLRAFLRRRLPEYMLPAQLVFLQELPLTSSGKVDRKALPQPASDTRRDLAEARPRNRIERVLCQAWEESLKVERVGIDDSFFELGGHSLSAVSMISRVQKTLGREISVTDVFRHPTIRELGAVMARRLERGDLEIAPAPGAESYPASSQQKRLYALQQLNPASVAYNMPAKWEVESSLTLDQLREVLDRMGERHEALRTSFEADGHSVRQFIGAQAVIEAELERIEGDDPSAAFEAFVRPFDLSFAPLARAKLVEGSGGGKWVFFDQHHIISDARSVSICIDEFQQQLQGQDPTPTGLQYKDYAVWQQEGQGKRIIAEQRDYWLSRFPHGDAPVLRLPTDFGRPPIQRFTGRSLRSQLEEDLTNRIRAFCRSRRLTVNMFLLAAFKVLLARYSGQEDFVVGCPVEGRDIDGLGGVWGMFVNTLALRSQPEGGQSFEDYLNSVKSKVLEALANQQYPFEELVEALQLERDPSRTPLFDVVLQHVRGVEAGLEGTSSKTTKFDLSLTAFEGSSRIVLDWEFAAHLFEDGTIRRWSAHFAQSLDGLLQAPERRLRNVRIVTDSEVGQLLGAFNATRTEAPLERTVVSLFRERAALQPHSPALVQGDRSMSYGELDECSQRWAQCLLSQHAIGEESIVAILSDRSLEMIGAIWAVLKAGGAYLPLDPELPVDRIAFMLEDSGAALLLCQSQYGNRIEFAGPRVDLEELAETSGQEASGAPSSDLEAAPQSSWLAYVIYTSGSTGRPKGTLIEHRSLSNLCQWHVREFGVTPEDQATALAGLGFDASVWEIFPNLIAGACLHLLDKSLTLDLDRLNEYIRSKRISIAFLPTQLGESFMGKGNRSLRTLLVGGDVLKRFSRQAYAVYNLYGPTENTVVATGVRLTQEGAKPPIGRPIDNVEVLILNPGGTQLQPVGIAGELCIAGASLARGYLNRPELNQAAFVEHPFTAGSRLYRTGDWARWRADGQIEFVGRKDSQVKLRGYRIELGEIEAVISESRQVEQCVVAAVEGSSSEKELCAYLVAGEGATEASLRQRVESSLPPYMMPAHWFLLEAMPLTPNGKIDRRALPKPQGAAERLREYAPARSQDEQLLCGIWEETLGVEQVGLNDHFFELGGHSLRAVHMVSRIREALSREVSVMEVFLNPTVKGLAALIASRERRDFDEVAAAPSDVSYPASSQQRRLYAVQQFDPSSTVYNIPSNHRLPEHMTRELTQSVLQALIDRHEALRTAFFVQEGQVRQKVVERVRFRASVQTVDAGASVDALMKAFIRPFDLHQAPLFRAKLVEVRGERPLLFLDLHHIISDARSHALVEEEALRLANGEILPPLELQYKDYAIWQQEGIGQQVIEAQRRYWLKQFQGGTAPVLQLPCDHPRPPVIRFEGKSFTELLDASAASRLRLFCREREITVNMALLTVFKVLLSKYSGQEDLVVGMPVEGRDQEELEGVMGMFVNTLALRSRPLAERPFEAYMLEVRDLVLGALEHQQYPFEDLIEQLDLERDPGRNPIFDVMFHYLSGFEPSESKEDEGFENAKFDLTLTVQEGSRRLALSWHYSLHLFEERTIRRMSRQFVQLLEGVLDRPGAPLGAFSLEVSSAEEDLLRRFNAATAPFDPGGTVVSLFQSQTKRRPESTALVQEGRRLTYAQLNAEANRFAACLIQKHGVGPDRIVAVQAQRSPDTVVAILGVLKAGGAYLPLDPAIPEVRRMRILAESGACLTVSADPQLETGACPLIGFDPGAEFALCVDDPQIAIHPRSLAYVIYTSGSTGRPKGVWVEHLNLNSSLAGIVEAFGFGPGQRHLLLANLAFDASVRQLLGPLVCGAELHIAEAFEVDPLLDLIESSGISVLNSSPKLLLELAQGVESTPPRRIGLETLISGGEALSGSDLEAIRRAFEAQRCFNSYGPTEATINASIHLCGQEREGGVVPIGKPVPNAQIHLMAGGKPCALGLIGEVCVSGLGVSRGYVKSPALTAQSFVPHGSPPGSRLYRTGDLGRWRPDGVLEYHGRNDDQVKLRGNRIELGEIESELSSLPEVRGCAVVVRSEGDRDQALCAYVTAATEADADALRSALRRRLPEYMIPSRWTFLDQLPLNISGKIDRQALPDPDRESKGSTGYRPPQTELETLLCAIWEDSLDLARVGVDDNFFDLGGHSLKAVHLASKIRHALGKEASMMEIFLHPTVRSLGLVIAARDKQAQSPVMPCEPRPHYPASSQQKRLFALQQLEPESIVYNMSSIRRLPKDIIAADAERVLNTIVSRHDAYRTSFHLEDGVIVQHVSPKETVRLELETVDEFRPDAALSGFMRPFDLSQAPLLRAKLLECASGERWMLLDQHHIIGDARSAAVFREEVRSLVEGRELPPVGLQYKDYAVWREEGEGKAIVESQRDFWLRQFEDGAPSPLQLPLDFARPAVQEFTGSSVRSWIDPKQTARLREFCRQRGVTVNMMLLAVFSLLLAKCSGQDDLALGTVVEGREREGLDEIIGMFVNTLALRCRPRPHLTFATYLGKVRSSMLDALENQLCPLEVLIEDLNLERDPSRNPLFDVMFHLLQGGAGVDASTERDWEEGLRISKFDLSLTALEGLERISLGWEYATHLFEEESIRSMAAHFEQLLESALSAPECRLADLQMATPQERQALTAGNSGASQLDLAGTSVVRQFEVQVERIPHSPAVICDGECLTYRELNQRSNQLAWLLRRRFGLARECLAALLLDRSPEMIVSILGVLKAGAAYVPLDPASPAARLNWLLEDCGAEVLLTQGSLDPALRFAGRTLDLSGEEERAESSLNPQSGPSLDSLAYLIYTSGSTGKPKGVLIEHGQLANSISASTRAFEIRADDRNLLLANYTFDASVAQIFGTLLSGAQLHIARAAQLENFVWLLDYADSHGITTLDTVPHFAVELADFIRNSKRKPWKLRTVICGGDVLSPADYDRICATIHCDRFINGYGPTETTIDAAFHLCEEEKHRLIPIGRPQPNTRIHLVKDGSLAPPGAVGEIALGGPVVGRGYLNQPGLTAQRFVPSPFGDGERMYLSGDCGRWRWDGLLEFRGRLDYQVQVRGLRIELGEIENVLSMHPGISSAAVTATQDRNGRTMLCAYYVSDGPVSEAELKEALKQSLPSHMIPTRWKALEAMPLTPSGKVSRRELPALQSKDAGDEDFTPPTTETERLLCAIWESVLGVERIGTEDNFFELGCHSLNAVHAVSKMRLHLQRSVSVRDVFRHATVARLARALDRKEEQRLQLIPASAERPDYPVSSQQRRIYALQRFEDSSTAYNMLSVRLADDWITGQGLQSVLDRLVARHEALRTEFFLRDGELRQRVLKQASIKVEEMVVDPADVDAEIDAFVRPFDLSSAPLARAGLLETEGAKYILLDQHHVVSDGRSTDIFFDEALRLAKGEELAPLPFHYKDFAVWQQEGVGRSLIRRQEAYWLERFGGELPAPLQLPADHPRPSVQRFEGKVHGESLTVEETERLRAFCRHRILTANMALLAVFKVLLARSSGQCDIVVGCPMEGRDREGLMDVFGMFVNTLAVRSSPSGEKLFSSYLQEVKRFLLEALDNQQYPFEELIERLPLERDPSRNPLFDVAFQLLTDDREEGEAFVVPTTAAKFDLTLTVFDGPKSIGFYWNYATHLFEAPTVGRMALHFKQLLHEILAQPDQAIADLEMVTDAERTQLLHDFNSPPMQAAPEESAVRMFENQAARAPRAAALFWRGQRLDYEELNRRANALARRLLREADLGPEDVVGVLADRCPAMIVGILAVLKAGGAYLPIDPELPRERISFMLQDSGARVLLAGEDYRDSAPFSGRVIRLEDQDGSAGESSDPPGPSSLDSLAYVIYTSGSTGVPKGVLLEHRGLANLCDWHVRAFDATSQDRTTALAGLGFDASVWEIFPYLSVGAGIHLLDKELAQDVDRLNDYLEANAITIAFLPTHLAQRFMQLTNVSLRTLLVGGDRLNRVPSCPYAVVNNYGPTEATVVSTSVAFSKDAENPSIGRPIDNVQAVVLQPEGDRLQPVGVSGELCIGGRGLARGYLNRPELTQERFIQHPYLEGERLYRSGDSVHWTPRGELVFEGRIDSQVKLRGYRIELGEIESLLSAYDAVEEAVACKVGLQDQEDSLCAYLVCSQEVDLSRLKQELRAKLPEYMVPSHWVRLDAMPLTPNGKIDRNALPAPGTESLQQAPYEEPEEGLERDLAQMWIRILGVERVGRKDNFFELGGNSLSSVEFLAAVEERTGQRLPLARVMIETLEELAVHCRTPQESQRGSWVRSITDRFKKSS